MVEELRTLMQLEIMMSLLLVMKMMERTPMHMMNVLLPELNDYNNDFIKTVKV
uniref:Uncharacterized protein n=1 Tax=Arundo donax TaxID=35708 RepID=A0A0A9A023_ARUDO